MSSNDRDRWDHRWRLRIAGRAGGPPDPQSRPPRHLIGLEHLLPRTGRALELACGLGEGTTWLAERGLDVVGYDVSPVAIAAARRRAGARESSARLRFEVADLDDGLPPGPPVELIVSHLFRAPALDPAVVRRLAPGGVLAVVALSEVGVGPGRFRVGPGELPAAFAELDVLHHSEERGVARLVGRTAGP